jgi:hypothetical protein
MIAPGNSIVQLVLALAFVIASGYASGRIHQWYKHGLERDHAFREGYDRASQSMFEMAIRAGRRTAVVETPPAKGTRTAGTTVRLKPAKLTQPHGASVVGQAPVPDSAVGASRRRILPHVARPATGRRRRHAA